MYKNIRNTVAPQFGYSHDLYLYNFRTRLKFTAKTAILVFGANFVEILAASFRIFRVKPINVFTGRGFRFSRQIVYKKLGKVSSYR